MIIVFSHPIADLRFSRKPKSGKLRIARYPLFHGKVIVEYPAHTLQDYLSPRFFQLFQLLAINEEPERYWVFPGIPGHLGIIAKKR